MPPSMSSTTPWLFPHISKEKAEGLITQGDHEHPHPWIENGKFFVRKAKPGAKGGAQYVLCLIYKGKPTHHTIGPGEDGKLMVNKRTYSGGQDTIEELVEVLSKPGVKGWPAPLAIPILYNEETAKGLPDGSGNVDGHSAAADSTMPWLHPKIKKADAEALASGGGDGTYLVWQRQAEEEFGLTVVFKTKPTHHNIKKNADGHFLIGKAQPVKGCADIKKLIEALQQPVKGWPVPLSNPVLYQPPVADALPSGPTGTHAELNARRESKLVKDLAAVNPGDDAEVAPRKEQRPTLASIDASMFDGDHNSPAADTHNSAPSPDAPEGGANERTLSNQTIVDPLNASTYSLTVTEQADASNEAAAVQLREKKPSAAGDGIKRRSITSAATGHKIGITASAYGRIEDNRLAGLSKEMQVLAAKLKAMFADADTTGGGYNVVDGIGKAVTDGKLSATEMRFRFDMTEMHNMVVAAGILPFFDQNHDGKVEFHELMAKLDTDGDSKISMDEFIVGWKTALTAREQVIAKEHHDLMNAVTNVHGVVPHHHKQPPPLNLSNRLVKPAGPSEAELALEQLTKVSAEAAQRLEERRQMALTLQNERLALEQQTRRYNAMVGGGGRGGKKAGAYEENPNFTRGHGKKKRGPRPTAQAFPLPRSKGYSPRKAGSPRGRQPKPGQFGAQAAPSMDLWSDSRKAAFARLRGKIKTGAGNGDAPGTNSTVEEVGKPGMYVTFGGFVEKDGADVVEELDV